MPIRKAVQDDFEAIQHLNNEIFLYEVERCEPCGRPEWSYEKYGAEYIKQITLGLDGFSAYVFEEHGDLLGYVALLDIPEKQTAHRNEIKAFQLHTLGVRADARGRGIGQALTEHVKEVAKQMGANRLRVTALAKNSYARNFYKKAGFREFEVTHEVEL